MRSSPIGCHEAKASAQEKVNALMWINSMLVSCVIMGDGKKKPHPAGCGFDLWPMPAVLFQGQRQLRVSPSCA
jgi:hypothetical protein